MAEQTNFHKHFVANKGLSFPVNDFTPAAIIAHETAILPPNPKFKKKGEQPALNVRFLFAGYVNDPDNGNIPTVVRKWTKWKKVSFNEKSGLTKMFKGVHNLEDLMNSDGPNGKLWCTPFKIMCEPSGKDGKYTDICLVTLDESDRAVDTDTLYYTADVKETIFKQVNAFGMRVDLQFATVKLTDGVKEFTPNDLDIEPADDEESENSDD